MAVILCCTFEWNILHVNQSTNTFYQWNVPPIQHWSLSSMQMDSSMSTTCFHDVQMFQKICRSLPYVDMYRNSWLARKALNDLYRSIYLREFVNHHGWRYTTFSMAGWNGCRIWPKYHQEIYGMGLPWKIKSRPGHMHDQAESCALIYVYWIIYKKDTFRGIKVH